MWTKVAGALGASAVGMGAIGAHALPPDLAESYVSISLFMSRWRYDSHLTLPPSLFPSHSPYPRSLTHPRYKKIYATGSNYHLVNSVMLSACAIALKHGRKRNIVCGLFTSGIFLFSGSCYAVAFMNERKPYSYPAPVGGFLLMGAYIAIGFLP